VSRKKHEVGTTERTAIKLGRSIAVTLPKEFIEAHGIKKGDKIIVSYDSFLLLEPKQRERILKEMEAKRRKLKRHE